VTIMIIFGSFLPSLLVGLAPPIYSDLGADIVYGIISLIIGSMREIALLTTVDQKRSPYD